MTHPLPEAGSVLAVFAHPDDESLAADGLLAALAARGVATAVVTATWAEQTESCPLGTEWFSPVVDDVMAGGRGGGRQP